MSKKISAEASIYRLHRVRGKGTLQSGDTVHLKTFDDKSYVLARDEGDVMANSDSPVPPSARETFEVIKIAMTGEIRPGDRIALRAYNGRYLSRQGDAGAIKATSDVIGDAESFELLFIGGGEGGSLGYPTSDSSARHATGRDDHPIGE